MDKYSLAKFCWFGKKTDNDNPNPNPERAANAIFPSKSNQPMIYPQNPPIASRENEYPPPKIGRDKESSA